jgi:hypothetical protein
MIGVRAEIETEHILNTSLKSVISPRFKSRIFLIAQVNTSCSYVQTHTRGSVQKFCFWKLKCDIRDVKFGTARD